MNYCIDWIAGQDGWIYVAESDARKSAKIHVVNYYFECLFCMYIYTELQPNAHSNRLIWLIISDTIINIRTNTYTQIYTWNKIYYYLLVIPISKKNVRTLFLWFSLSLRNSVLRLQLDLSDHVICLDSLRMWHVQTFANMAYWMIAWIHNTVGEWVV